MVAPMEPSRKRELSRSKSTTKGFILSLPAQVMSNLEEYVIPLFYPPTMASLGPILYFSLANFLKMVSS